MVGVLRMLSFPSLSVENGEVKVLVAPVVISVVGRGERSREFAVVVFEKEVRVLSPMEKAKGRWSMAEDELELRRFPSRW